MKSFRGSVMLFDGVCNLCNGVVQFVLRNDPSYWHFASVQSRAGAALLEQHGITLEAAMTRIVVVDRDEIYMGSSAILRVMTQLRAPWWVLGSVGMYVPALVRDTVYDWVASNRYGIFGQTDACMLPSPAVRARFLDWKERKAASSTE
jgi:predicted DCC family thiol-disulfide oxidoreductase YuxK